MRRHLLHTLLGFGLLLFSLEAAAGAIVIFKDGFLIHGQVRQREDVELDHGHVVPIRKGEVYLDDDVRYFKFSHSQVDYVDNKDSRLNADLVRLQTPRVSRFFTDVVPSVWKLEEVREWNGKWERSATVVTLGGAHIPLTQRLGLLTPHVARADALRYNWSEWFLTQELEPAKVRDLLYQHPELKLKQDKNDAGRCARICRFLLQAGWNDLADQEIKALARAFPQEKEKIDSLTESLQKARAAQLYGDLDIAYHAGRHDWVQKHLPDFFKLPAEEKPLAWARTLRGNYETAGMALKDARRLLENLMARISPGRHPLLIEAAAAIDEELSLADFLPALGPEPRKGPEQLKRLRLDLFVALAGQAERTAAQGHAPNQTPEELLALAVTGWLQGKDAAAPKPEAAERLWQARRFLLEYQRSPSLPARQKLAAAYQKRSDGPLSAEELAGLIAFLPAPEPATEISVRPVTRTAPSRRRRGIRYLLQAPPEYHSGRAYPVIIALHDWQEAAQDALDRWTRAKDHGYFLVAPEWPRLPGQAYDYTADEHLAVLDVLRDLRRHYQIDSDRVFLTGFGDGGSMAFDVGLSHPDLFAGVLPIAGRPRQFVKTYWPNAQALPFYVVNGGAMGESAKDATKMFDRWIPRGYPALHVIYKGRGREWFSAEVPAMLQWMDRKVRARGIPQIGRGSGVMTESLVTLRPTDDHFYWLTADAIDPQHLSDGTWDVRITPAELAGKLGDVNQVSVTARHVQQLGVWFTFDMRDRIDFEKPVTIRLNGGVIWNNRKVKADVNVLLEDFYARGDRQRLYLAKVELGRPR